LGLAYGLEGNHFAWANTPQHELGSLIAAKMAELMSEQGAAGPVSVSDGFFGEAGALDVMGDPFASGPGGGASPQAGGPPAAMPGAGPGPMAHGGPAPPARSGYDEVPVGVPTSSLGLVIIVAGALVVVVALVVIAVVFIL
jgi:hypothetical protein